MHRISIFMNLCKGNRMELRSSTYYVSVCFSIYSVYTILLATGPLGSSNTVDLTTSQHGANTSELPKVFLCCCNGDVAWDLGKEPGGQGCILLLLYDFTFSSPNLTLTIVLEIVFRFILMMTELRLKQE